MQSKVAKGIWAEIQEADVQAPTGAELTILGKGGSLDFVSVDTKSLQNFFGTSSMPSDSFEERKRRVEFRAGRLQKSLDRKLKQIRREMMMAVGSAVITGALTLGADAWSDKTGTATTLLGGSSGTGGIFLATKDSFLSYYDTKTNYYNYMDDLTSRIHTCESEEILVGIEKEINAMFDKIHQKAIKDIG